jgi:hypothetical protein
MKKIILQIVLMIFCFSLFGQEKQVYYFTLGTPLKGYDLTNGVRLAGATANQHSTQGWRFKIEQDIGDAYIISFLPWKEYKRSKKKLMVKNDALNKRFVIENSENKYFEITKQDFFEYVQKDKTPPKCSFTTGAITVPIKIRFGTKNKEGVRTRYFDFYGDINLGIAAGFKYRPWKSPDMYLNFLPGIGITSVAVDSLTTHGYIKTSTKAAALTPSFSFVWEIKEFQIGLSVGIDYLSRDLGDQWDYKDQVWLGIGMGYSIFKTNQAPTTQVEDN